MVHHSYSRFTSLAEVSIFSAKEIVGALRNNIVHEIPCLKNQAGDFCIYNNSIAFAEKGKADEFSSQAELFSPTGLYCSTHVFRVSTNGLNCCTDVSGVRPNAPNFSIDASGVRPMALNFSIDVSGVRPDGLYCCADASGKNVLPLNSFRINKHNTNQSISIN